MLFASGGHFFRESAGRIVGEGWAGFTDVRFLLIFVVHLLLATLLAALIAYHPRAERRFDTLEEVEAPKSFILYAIVAAVIGTAVVQFGDIVGFVIFGIGGLLRFRTNVGAATQTGRVIFVTVIGLCVGLELPQVAILATAYGWLLLWLIDRHTSYSMVVQGIHKGDIAEAAEGYRRELECLKCTVLGERKNLDKHTLRIIFRGPPALDLDEAEERFEKNMHEKHRGAIDWEWR
ncbi:MAG: hypothetical protein MI757_19785 [Pirellulales bacterium]|nr:hypothetical protein [Pirellulales bacterium]